MREVESILILFYINIFAIIILRSAGKSCYTVWPSYTLKTPPPHHDRQQDQRREDHEFWDVTAYNFSSDKRRTCRLLVLPQAQVGAGANSFYAVGAVGYAGEI